MRVKMLNIDAATAQAIIGYQISASLFFGFLWLFLSLLFLFIFIWSVWHDIKKDNEFKEKIKQRDLEGRNNYYYESESCMGFTLSMLGIFFMLFMISVYQFSCWFEAKYYPTKYLYNYRRDQLDSYKKEEKDGNYNINLKMDK